MSEIAQTQKRVRNAMFYILQDPGETKNPNVPKIGTQDSPSDVTVELNIKPQTKLTELAVTVDTGQERLPT